MKDKNTGLTEKETLFIAEYCQNDFNGTQAAIKAGYSKKTARQIATTILTKVHIREAVKKYLNDIIGQYKDTLEYEIIQHYKLLAFYNPDEIIDHDGKLIKKSLKSYGKLAKVIKGIQVTYNAKGKKQKKILLQDRDNALEKLAQYMSLLKQNVYLTTKDEMGTEDKEELKKELRDILKDELKNV